MATFADWLAYQDDRDDEISALLHEVGNDEFLIHPEDFREELYRIGAEPESHDALDAAEEEYEEALAFGDM